MSELQKTFETAIKQKASQSEDDGQTREELLKFYHLVEASLHYPESVSDSKYLDSAGEHGSSLDHLVAVLSFVQHALTIADWNELLHGREKTGLYFILDGVIDRLEGIQAYDAAVWDFVYALRKPERPFREVQS